MLLVVSILTIIFVYTNFVSVADGNYISGVLAVVVYANCWLIYWEHFMT